MEGNDTTPAQKRIQSSFSSNSQGVGGGRYLADQGYRRTGQFQQSQHSWQRTGYQNGQPYGQQPQRLIGFNYQYPSTGSGRRTRRSSRRMAKYTFRLPSNTTSATPIVKLVPVLKTLNGTFEYVIAHGDSNVFKVDQYRGVTYLHIRRHLPRKGIFRLLIKGLLHHKIHKTRSRDEIGMREAKKFAMKLRIKIV